MVFRHTTKSARCGWNVGDVLSRACITYARVRIIYKEGFLKKVLLRAYGGGLPVSGVNARGGRQGEQAGQRLPHLLPIA